MESVGSNEINLGTKYSVLFSRTPREYGLKCFHLKAEGSLGNNTHTCYSTPIVVMYNDTNRQMMSRSYQLSIVNNIEPIWYKDEKGKKHSIPIQVKLSV